MSLTPIPRLILGLSVPAVISMLVTNIYNLVDTAFVGQLGTSASGAVGIVFGFMSIIQAIGFMFGQGAGSILSRALGMKDRQSASVNASAGFFASFLSGVLICIFGFVFLDDMVFWLGSTQTIAPFAKTYITYILISAPFMCSCLTLNNILRYEGRAFLGMIGLMSGAILNMAVDPVLMFGLDLGIAGAGLSTALSQLISWGILLFMFLSGKTESKLSIKNAVYFTPRLFGNIMATGFPSLLRQVLNSITAVMLCGVRRRGCGGYEHCVANRIFRFFYRYRYRSGIPACCGVQLRSKKIFAPEKRLLVCRACVRDDNLCHHSHSCPAFG